MQVCVCVRERERERERERAVIGWLTCYTLFIVQASCINFVISDKEINRSAKSLAYRPGSPFAKNLCCVAMGRLGMPCSLCQVKKKTLQVVYD